MQVQSWVTCNDWRENAPLAPPSYHVRMLHLKHTLPTSTIQKINLTFDQLFFIVNVISFLQEKHEHVC